MTDKDIVIIEMSDHKYLFTDTDVECADLYVQMKPKDTYTLTDELMECWQRGKVVVSKALVKWSDRKHHDPVPNNLPKPDERDSPIVTYTRDNGHTVRAMWLISRSRPRQKKLDI